MMDIEFTYECFDYYIEEIHENDQILNYIQWNRKQPNGEDIYGNFDYIFEKVRAYGKK
jgi:hypothetical protein